MVGDACKATQRSPCEIVICEICVYRDKMEILDPHKDPQEYYRIKYCKQAQTPSCESISDKSWDMRVSIFSKSFWCQFFLECQILLPKNYDKYADL